MDYIALLVEANPLQNPQTLKKSSIINTIKTRSSGTLEIGNNSTTVSIPGKTVIGGALNISSASDLTVTGSLYSYGPLSISNSTNKNVGVGNKALIGLTTGSSFDNTAMGYKAGTAITTGSCNTAVGSGALDSITTGTNNIAIGYYAGKSMTTGSETCNILIGSGGTNGQSNAIHIGIPGAQTKCYVAGIRGVTTGKNASSMLIDSNGQIGTSSSSRKYKDDIEDMADVSRKLLQLRPVTFTYKAHGSDRSTQFGLIAEEVAEVMPEIVAFNDNKPETVHYHFLSSLLLNEYQRQNKLIESLESEIDQLRRNHDREALRSQELEAQLVQIERELIALYTDVATHKQT